ncbi:hypothetical protein [Sodalis sp. RH19]|uniref:hypothetical protein n=1 Tax=Sodalis sp. RH19 TaxID=3394334 RepID=UPI0039B47DE6
MHGLYDIYEKIYFKSLADREKIIGRVQLNFTIYVSMFAVLFYMLRMIDYDNSLLSLIIFFFMLLLCLLFIAISIYFTYKSISGKYDYLYFTPHHEMAKYRNELIKFRDNANYFNFNNKEKIQIPDINSNLKTNVFNILGVCSDKNNELNKIRMISVRKSMSWIWFSGFLFIITSAIFAVTDLDVSSPRKDTLVKDQNLANAIKQFGQDIVTEMRYFMSNDKRSSSVIKPGPTTGDVLYLIDGNQKPTLPIPPSYQVIPESYSLKQPNN